MVAGTRNLTLNDFKPVNSWTEDPDPNEVYDTGGPMYIIDQSTGEKYLNHSPLAKLVVFLILATVGTPVCHTLSMIGHTAYRIAKLMTGAHFWIPKENEKAYSLKKRGLEAAEDLLKIVTAPLVLCALEASAIYAFFRPLDGSKLYASFERFAFYDRFFLAPCCQPSPTRHLLGGDLRTRDTL